MVYPREKLIMDIATFGHLLTFTNLVINHHLVAKLVDRWRSETQNFHLPLEETTIILEDVVLQLGLLIDGEVVTGFINGDLVLACQHLLDATPPENVVARVNQVVMV